MERINSPKWKRRRIKEIASICVGVDILQELVEKLVTEGFSIKCLEATSNAFIGKKFDIIHIRDVIEHVDNP